MHACKARFSPPPLGRERASAVFEQLRPGVSLCSSAPELSGAQQCWVIYSGKDQVLLTGYGERCKKRRKQRENPS